MTNAGLDDLDVCSRGDQERGELRLRTPRAFTQQLSRFLNGCTDDLSRPPFDAEHRALLHRSGDAAYRAMRADPRGVVCVATEAIEGLDRGYTLEWRNEEEAAAFGFEAEDGGVGADRSQPSWSRERVEQEVARRGRR